MIISGNHSQTIYISKQIVTITVLRFGRQVEYFSGLSCLCPDCTSVDVKHYNKLCCYQSWLWVRVVWYLFTRANNWGLVRDRDRRWNIASQTLGEYLYSFKVRGNSQCQRCSTAAAI